MSLQVNLQLSSCKPYHQRSFRVRQHQIPHLMNQVDLKHLRANKQENFQIPCRRHCQRPVQAHFRVSLRRPLTEANVPVNHQQVSPFLGPVIPLQERARFPSSIDSLPPISSDTPSPSPNEPVATQGTPVNNNEALNPVKSPRKYPAKAAAQVSFQINSTGFFSL